MSNRFQKGVDFKSIEGFLEFITPEENQMVSCLREIILDEIPDVKEKLSYHVPFYSRKQRICFLWPASIPWGNTPRNGVILGFTKGHLMQHPIIKIGDRKEVGEIQYQHISEIDEETVRMLLMEALMIDQES